MKVRNGWLLAGALLVIVILVSFSFSFQKAHIKYEQSGIIEKGSNLEENATIETSNITNVTCEYCQYPFNYTCLNYSCCLDSQCQADERCSDNRCLSLDCGNCQHIENHQCMSYECCNNGDCGEGQKCIDNECKLDGSGGERSISFESVQKGIAEYTGYMGNACLVESEHQTGNNLTCVSVIINDADLEKLRARIKQYSVDSFLDFDNYLLIAVSYRGEAPFIEIKDIKQNGDDIKIYFYIWWGSPEKTGAETTLHIVKIKKLDLMPKQNLNFIFTGNETYGSSLGQWLIPNVDIPSNPNLPYEYVKDPLINVTFLQSILESVQENYNGNDKEALSQDYINLISSIKYNGTYICPSRKEWDCMPIVPYEWKIFCPIEFSVGMGGSDDHLDWIMQNCPGINFSQ